MTTEGKLVLKIHERYSEMLRPEQATTLHCTPITHDLLVETISGLEAKGEKYQISINDDWQNLKALYLGRADLVIFDDPNYAIEFEGFKEDKILIIDLYKDTLIHHRNGSRYIKFKYGAQRLGFRHLDAANKKYKILYETSSLKQLINSKYSFFLNHSIIQQNNISLSNNDDSQMFIHPIMAISINPTEKIRELAKSLKQHSAAISYSGDK